MEYQIEYIHEKLFEMMTVFDSFCKENHLEYYLIGGSALGALRHNGFIPWDDDVDVALKRKDFEKMEDILKNQMGNHLGRTFAYVPTEHNGPTGHLYYYFKDVKQKEKWIAIDIYPLDNVPSSILAQEVQRIFCQVYHLATYRMPPKNRGRLMRVGSQLVLKCSTKAFLDRIESMSKKIITYWNSKNTQMISNLFGIAGYKKEMVPNIYFGNSIPHKFETGVFPIPERSHEYMQHIYGNYMELPPIEKRVPKHLL